MILSMRSLFLKIFLWFWITVIATGVALAATWIILQPKNALSQLQAILADAAWASGTATVNELERQGTWAASAYMQQFSQKSHMKTCLFAVTGQAISGSDCSIFNGVLPPTSTSGNPTFSSKHGVARVFVKVQGTSGRQYIYAVAAAERRGPSSGIGLLGVPLRWSVSLLVSGFICYLLARYLTAPILRLREASQHLAQGDLSTRATAGMERRRDELGLLVQDFNAMAERIEELVSRQRQLIYDISHELRSPLARLNVALDLARGRKGNDPAFDHMEQDLERLNDMIGRLLTVARLDSSAIPVAMSPVDLTELISQIARSADLELRKSDAAVQLNVQGQLFVQGNAELLHSAIENVVRNAIRHTGIGNPVEVSVTTQNAGERSFARIVVRDRGPGVPESELGNIFQPFYRVADDRNRQSGGTGLGLAIASRVVRIHGGTICARNVQPHGLEVEILLPQAPFNAAIFT
jgi:two-component system, OmpR family, sensor histidine kinase CpxA